MAAGVTAWLSRRARILPVLVAGGGRGPAACGLDEELHFNLGRYEVQPGVLTAFLDRPQLRPHNLDRIG